MDSICHCCLQLIKKGNAMLVVHPIDRTTEMLSILYEGLDARLIESECSKHEMKHLLCHTSPSERIMLLGHGSDNGLYFRRNDETEGFDGIVVGHQHAYCLRKHCGGIIGIWCHAVEFARKEGLHGLFSGMIISEMSEAEEYGVATDKESMDKANRIMFIQLRRLLDDGTPLHEIPERLRALDITQSDLSRFNYERFYYL